MPDPFTVLIAGYIATNAPHWLEDLRTTLFNTSKAYAVTQGKVWLSEQEQQRHLQQALKKAVRRGLTSFQKPQERDQYKDILANLFEPGAHSDTLRREAMTIFTLSDTPDLAELNEIYNRSLRFRALTQATPPAEVQAAPYLTRFFEALIVELYADPLFKSQISDVLQTRAAALMPQQLAETNTTLREIHETIKDDYTEERFQQDIEKYAAHLERILHNLKIGFIPKDQNRDPELNGIFVPLRIALSDQPAAREKQQNSLVTLLEQYPHLVLLGDPGSGKTTAVKHLAWSHAKANAIHATLDDVALLSRHPLPLRIELRLLMRDRNHHPDYSFLSYVVEVLLRRENVLVDLRMFERLLVQRRMLLLFDGLDEVTTLDERQSLVQEIDHFAQSYPGNYILVTSRPIGYDLAACSRRIFTHASIQSFDDEQIRQFLERWYTYVLQLSPLPYESQQELELLFTTLRENPRLHTLAENPLLLTVITALYRSQRLPEKRVQVYDKCAELLLETWARLKGTDIRWANMRTSKDDQFACVAYLGFKLHERSQEDTQSSGRSTKDTATDVPGRLMLREIENFLKSRKLIVEVAEQHKEAELFLSLVQVEAGLIVERGTDENGESLYGFVHRTFQEYFAASDVYERYRQDEDPAIISDFLVKHLHDPHWHEVILLLLGKLGRKPVSLRLRQILDGKIRSNRSDYTDILQQDLFFVCDFLAEDMQVENDLAEFVVESLGNVIMVSPFESQCSGALERLGKLMQTKQFASLGKRKLIQLANQGNITDISLKIQIAEALYANSPESSEEKEQAAQMLLQLAQQPDLSMGHRIQAARALYSFSSEGSGEQQQATKALLQLAQRPDLSIEDRIQAAQVLYRSSTVGSEEKKQAAVVLLQLAQRADLSIEHRIRATRALYSSSPEGSKERQQVGEALLQLVRQSDLSMGHCIQAAKMLLTYSPSGSEEHQQVSQMLLQLAQHADLSIEDRIQAAKAHYGYGSKSSEGPQQAAQMLLQLVQQPDLSMEHRIQAVKALYQFSPQGSEEKQQAAQMLLQLVQQPDLSMEHHIQAVEALYRSSPQGSEEEQQAAKAIWKLVQHSRITSDQRLYVITIPIKHWKLNYAYKMQAFNLLLALLLREEVKDYLAKHWSQSSIDVQPAEIPFGVELAKQELLPAIVRDIIYEGLFSSIPEFNKLHLYDDSQH